MIDWHSHILPGVDDGSRDIDQSLMMLDELIGQRVDTVLATPHFFAGDESVDQFLNRRNAAYDALCSHMGERDIRVLCGAEVKYYAGISRMADLDKLAIGDTRVLLLEMSMEKWTDFTIQELTELAGTRGLKIVMAHVERYLGYIDTGTIRRLRENGLYMQVNAGFFERVLSRNKACRLLGSGLIHFIGSDCHNLTSRPPRIAPAYELIRKRFGEEFLSQLVEYGYYTLEK